MIYRSIKPDPFVIQVEMIAEFAENEMLILNRFNTIDSIIAEQQIADFISGEQPLNEINGAGLLTIYGLCYLVLD